MVLFEINLKLLLRLIWARVGTTDEVFRIRTDEDYGYQMWTKETPRGSKSVDKVKFRDPNIHYLTKLLCKINLSRGICQGCLRTTSNVCFCKQNLLKISFK